MKDLFSTPIKSKYVRDGVIAHQYINGNININGKIYCMYSMTNAIKQFRKDYPKRGK